jgi:pyruvate dehydrogenase kinase 2/3/4
VIDARLAHRIRDMQTLPYVVVTNPHISQVYELYYKAFESLRRVREIKSLEDNERFCTKISHTLQEHLTVIPSLAMGVLECRNLMKAEDMDRFMNGILRSVCFNILPALCVSVLMML